MKFVVKLLLVFFILFQFSTTIVYIVNSGNDDSISMLLLEEASSKENKEIKELKTDFILSNPNEFLAKMNFIKSKTDFYYLLTDYTSESNLFLPPPELS